MGSTDDVGRFLGPFILVVVIVALLFVIAGAFTPGYGLPGSTFSDTVSDVTGNQSANESTESNSSTNTTGEDASTVGDQGALQGTVPRE